MTWDDVYREHWRPLVAWCWRRFGPGLDPENVAQAAVVRVWQSQRADVPGWSFRVLRWHLQRAARDYVFNRPNMIRLLHELPVRVPAREPDAPPDPETVWRAVDRTVLPAGREVLRLYYRDGLTDREVGGRIGRSRPEAARVRHDSIARLRAAGADRLAELVG